MTGSVLPHPYRVLGASPNSEDSKLMNTRLTALFAGTTFALAGAFGAPAAALAANTPTTPATDSSDVAASSVVAQVADTTTHAESGPAPSDGDLHPMAVTADQQTFTPTTEQLSNAKAIVDEAKAMNLPPRAWEIAVATSLQETNLKNLGDLGAHNDHDSLGLFQQRTSTGGWGTADQIMDPAHATNAFLSRLVKLNGWDQMPLTQAAQKVQVSAYPQAYAKHEAEAGNIIGALYGNGPYADAAHNIH
ncbi:MAG TPA: hypothetical protein VL179_14515 [Mycobacterium sp.]|nr:hypothetical protein [Mycobacterium sp.]